MSAIDVLDRLASFGCAVRIEGEKLKVRGPNLPEVAALVSELHARRDDAITILRDTEGPPPSIEEIQAALPCGVTLVSYQAKQTPFDVAPVSIVTNAGRFFRAYLRDLKWRLEHPDGYAAPPLTDILSKLADAGLELKIGKPGAFINAHGLDVSDDDIPF
ncbi:MAG TPA: hypothetical protein VMW54_13845 [Terriglobia bacterium]|nr:hypothetical protein [Terriglobia bacterium]